MADPKPINLSGWDITIDGKTKSVLHSDVMNYYEVVWGQSDKYWRENVKPDWDKNASLYQDRYSMPFHRFNWQTTMKDPVVDNMITRITYFMQKNLVNIGTQGKYFTVKHPNAERAKAYEEYLRILLRESDYPKKFTKSFAKSLLNSVMAHKIVYTKKRKYKPVYDTDKKKWTKLVPETRGGVEVVTIDPYNIRLDPYGDEYIIEQVTKVPLHEFKKAAEANGWINIKAVMQTLEPELKNGSLPTVNIKYVYTKSLLNPSGDEISPHIYFVVVEDKYVVHLENYILPNGEFPYSVANPMMDVYGRYGRPYVSKIHDLVTHFVGFQNLMLDQAYLSALGIHEYDVEVASSDAAHSFTSKLEPGKMYPKLGNGSMLNSLFPSGNVTQSLMQVGYVLDRELQNKGYVNEFFTGQATSKGRPTLGEINLKTQESSAFFADMSAHIESEKLSEDLRLTLTTGLMHVHTHKDDFERLISQAPQEIQQTLKSLTVEEIMADIVDMKVQVTGISGKIQRMANFSRYLQIWQVIGNMPGIQASTLLTKFVRKMFEIIDDTPEEVLDMEEMEKFQELMQQVQMQQMQAALSQPPQQEPTPQGGQGDPRSQPAGIV